ncbi:MAG: DUF1385 domain-containing protein [Candidatus Dormibacteria bacterium]
MTRRRPSLGDLLLTAAVNAASAPPAPFFYGGQAVIEGVLMRGRNRYAVAARRPDGSITVITERLRSRVYTNRLWALPFFRGVASLYEMLNLGMRALQWSANVQLGEEAEMSAGTMRVTIAISVVFGLGLFIALPLGIASLLHHGAPQSPLWVLVEGGARAAILLLYLLLIGQVRSVSRVFEYHGAEHKAINCLESGAAVDVESVRACSRLHPRCGTGFLLIVALVSILVFIPLSPLFWPVRIACEIVLVPLVAAIAYELIRGLARIRHTRFGRIALGPVLATQLLTTRQPDGPQMEVAIAALAAARGGDGEGAAGEGHDALAAIRVP